MKRTGISLRLCIDKYLMYIFGHRLQANRPAAAFAAMKYIIMLAIFRNHYITMRSEGIVIAGVR